MFDKETHVYSQTKHLPLDSRHYWQMLHSAELGLNALGSKTKIFDQEPIFLVESFSCRCSIELLGLTVSAAIERKI